MAAELQAWAERAQPPREALHRWFQLEPSQSLHPAGNWVVIEQGDRGRDSVSLGGIYRSSTSCYLAFDWEQPPVERVLRNPLRWGLEGVIPCFVCELTTFFWEPGWHTAWVLLQCLKCQRRWYCISYRRRSTCRARTPELPRYYNPRVEKARCEIVNLIYGKAT